MDPVVAAPPDRAVQLDGLFRGQRKRLWALAYRLTGSAEDADDVVQESFSRLLAQPPELALETVGPWLARVATNLGIDTLRRRRRRAYVGPWLPAPLESPEDNGIDTLATESLDPEARYGLAESATYAFLLALEALGPRQRAVLLLRDVLGHSPAETAELLATTQGSVRVLHLRARRALAAYDVARCIPTAELRERHRAVLQRFLDCLERQDAGGLEALFADSVHTLTDAAGAYTALTKPLVGRAPVARLYLMAAEHRRAGGTHSEIRLVNGLPAALITLLAPVRKQAPRSLLRCELDATGHIQVVHAILAPRKLAKLFPT